MRAAAALLLLAALVALPPVAAQGTQSEPFRIGRMSPNSAEADEPNLRAFRDGLHDLGWEEGRDYVMAARFADGRLERLPGIAAELLASKVQLLLVGSNVGVQAAKAATSTVPIVMVTTGNPVEAGLVSSLARPSGNVTGLTALAQDLNSKRLELLKEALPGLARVAVLSNSASPDTRAFLREKDAAAQRLGLRLAVFEARDATAVDGAFASMMRQREPALMVLNDILFISQRKQIVALATRNRLPAIYAEREFVEAGGLMFYGASLVDLYRRAASYAQRISKGAKPSDLPIEQPTRLDLVVNLKAAREIGITLPRAIVGRADQVIE